MTQEEYACLAARYNKHFELGVFFDVDAQEIKCKFCAGNLSVPMSCSESALIHDGVVFYREHSSCRPYSSCACGIRLPNHEKT